MSRKLQDTLTWVLAAGLLVSQAIPGIPEKPYIIAGAFGLLGLPTIRQVQEHINEKMKNGGKEEAKK